MFLVRTKGRHYVGRVKEIESRRFVFQSLHTKRRLHIRCDAIKRWRLIVNMKSIAHLRNVSDVTVPISLVSWRYQLSLTLWWHTWKNMQSVIEQFPIHKRLLAEKKWNIDNSAFIYIFICLEFYLLIHLFIYLFICLFISVYWLINLSTNLGS